MRSLPKIKAAIETQLSLYPKNVSDQLSDDTIIRLSSEEELLKKLLVITEDFIQEQVKLEQHLETHV
ncbi:MAG: hypothetical protein H6Q67_1993 [Firmicutes bacterium]|nr:hypothetical protein [Bacillota bacterium]